MGRICLILGKVVSFPFSDGNGPVLSENGDVRMGLGFGLGLVFLGIGQKWAKFVCFRGGGGARGADDACLHGRGGSEAGLGALWAAVSLICGGFGWPQDAGWLIYGTGTRICQVPALRFCASYLRYHVLRAIYKPLSGMRPPESAMYKTVGGCVGRFCLAGAWGRGGILSFVGFWECMAGPSSRFRAGFPRFRLILGMWGWNRARVWACGFWGWFSSESDGNGVILSDSGDGWLGSGVDWGWLFAYSGCFARVGE